MSFIPRTATGKSLTRWHNQGAEIAMRWFDNMSNAFFALLRAGLWEQPVRLLPYSPLDMAAVFRLAEEQSVIGLIAAGLDYVEDTKLPKQQVLPFLKHVIALENRNVAMNYFIGAMTDKMREAGIDALLVKGQGVAQCYARPQWRSSGDVDFFFDAGHYQKAKELLTPLAETTEGEDKRRLHLGMTISPWVVELHGTMHGELSGRINDELDLVQKAIFEQGGVRVWRNGDKDVFLPDPDNDVIIVFTHFIQHFFVGGVGLRQISDWCRLLWTYRKEINQELLGRRLKRMGLMSEWQAFAFFAVSYMGMPLEAMPFHHSSSRLSRKAHRICRIILQTGNFGRNKNEGYRGKYPVLVEKSITFGRRLCEFLNLSCLFPLDGPRFFVTYVLRRSRTVIGRCSLL